MLALLPVATAVGIGALAALMAAGPARSQQSQSQTQTQQPPDQKQDQQKPDISVDVKLVNVFATVRDKKGSLDLDRVATHVLAFEGDSQVRWFEGNFEASRATAANSWARRPTGRTGSRTEARAGVGFTRRREERT